MNSCDFPPLHTLLDQPADVLAAVTHADPYPYYDGLSARSGLRHDARLGLWIAASAASVREVLSHPDCLVRPLAEPVPAAILGGAAGQVFGALVRMNEGVRHEQPKLALQRALAGLPLAQAGERTAQLAQELWRGGDTLAEWMLALPVSVVASLMGFADAQLPQVAAWMADFVACLSPLSSALQIDQAHVAAQALLERLTELVRQAQEGAQPESLIARVAAEAESVGWNDSAALLANLAGLLSQTYEATAGLIGNSIVALVRQPEEERSEPEDADTLVHTVQRCDSPIQNTRRFVARDCEVEGVVLKAGDVVLLVLAAAARDPDADCHPFGFGYGRHACPGEALATTIATSALQMLMAGPLGSPESLQALRWTYRRSLNARIPVFA
jgi:cytochrome P450